LADFDAEYPLSQSLFTDSIPLNDPNDHYVRWMKIGIK
jgi:hypothetical protein